MTHRRLFQPLIFYDSMILGLLKGAQFTCSKTVLQGKLTDSNRGDGEISFPRGSLCCELKHYLRHTALYSGLYVEEK